MRRRLPALGAALALVGPACAQSYADNAGHGGIYLDVDLRARTGNDGHLGCADVGGSREGPHHLGLRRRAAREEPDHAGGGRSPEDAEAQQHVRR